LAAPPLAPTICTGRMSEERSLLYHAGTNDLKKRFQRKPVGAVSALLHPHAILRAR
jgi:hypothetical protein